MRAARALPAILVSRLSACPLTYGEAGETAGMLPPGYNHMRRQSVLGCGEAVFTFATEALMTWQMHLRAGLHVAASSPTARQDTVVLLGLGAGPLRVSAPCRVIYAVNEPRRCGFAYGTLPGHPERGEEAFLVSHHDDDSVTLTVIAFSRPATLLARAAGPAGLAIQACVTRRYLRALTIPTGARSRFRLWHTDR